MVAGMIMNFDGAVSCFIFYFIKKGTGGAYGKGSRMPIKATRALLTAALNGSLNSSSYRKDDNFGFEVPTHLDGVFVVQNKKFEDHRGLFVKTFHEDIWRFGYAFGLQSKPG